MNPVPFDLPVRPAEAAALAGLIFEQAEGKPLTEDLRNRLAGRAAALRLETSTAWFGSLERDPVHPSTYYLAIDGIHGAPLLLHIAPAAAPTSGVFPKAVLVGRMRTPAGREIVINCLPFGAGDHAQVRAYAEQINRSFLPRAQGPRPAIAVGNRHPEISLPAVFDAFRAILKKTGINLAPAVQLSATREMTTDAALAARDGEDPTAPGYTRVSIRQLWHAGLWAAIRAGWREGYNAAADHLIVDDSNASLQAAREAIRHAAAYTRFTTDTARLIARVPEAGAEVEEQFERCFPAAERDWIAAEFEREFVVGDKRYEFSRTEAHRLAVKFGKSLRIHEQLYDCIRQTKAASGLGRSFDFEVSFDEAETLTTPKELIGCLHWLRARGRAAQLVAPNLGFRQHRPYDGPLSELECRVREFAAIARHFQATLSVHSGSGQQAEVLELIGKATGGRVNYKIPVELELQLLDVLAEQPAESPWRRLYERMVTRAREFATRGAFGSASPGGNGSLGDPRRGRVDGDPFLIQWLGCLVGSRDIHDPDGDQRFFKDKLSELPRALAAEVRRRNTAYIIWVAGHLLP